MSHGVINVEDDGKANCVGAPQARHKTTRQAIADLEGLPKERSWSTASRSIAKPLRRKPF